jgi:hypothetical protein
MRTSIRRTTAIALTGMLALAGCAAGGSDQAATADLDVEASDDAYRTAAEEGWGAADGEEPAFAVDEAEDTADGGEVDTDGDRAGPNASPATLGRRVIRTATIELESADPNRLAQEVSRTVSALGGFVATSDLRRDDQGVLRGTVTVRVPSDALDATLDDLEELADNAPVRRIDERDVTVESADLEAQLTNLTAYETELRGLLADVRETTTRPEDLLTIFERVRQVRAEIDQIQGRLAVLSDQVSMATITVGITPTRTALPVTDPTWEPGSTAREALTAAARTLRGVADAAIWFGLAVLPVLAVFAVPLVLGWVVWRRRGRGHATPPPGDGPPTAAPSAPVA